MQRLWQANQDPAHRSPYLYACFKDSGRHDTGLCQQQMSGWLMESIQACNKQVFDKQQKNPGSNPLGMNNAYDSGFDGCMRQRGFTWVGP